MPEAPQFVPPAAAGRRLTRSTRSTCPVRSARLYARMEPSQTRLFRYLLEAEDNLAYTSVVDRKICILKVVFAPEQRKQLLHSLKNMRQTLKFELLDLAALSQPDSPDSTSLPGLTNSNGWADPSTFLC